MEDQDLLELAAKAIGEEFHSGHITVGGRQFEWVEWSPLTDDGDALRLAVSIFKDIHFWYFDNSVSVGNCLRVPIDGDPCAATRRAIVRAAAEIGKQQPSAEGDL